MLFRTGGDSVVPEPRRRPLDNPRVLIIAAVLLLSLLAGLFWLSARTSEIAAPLVTDVLLYVLVAVDLALLAALLFVLARNLLKLWVEQRRALPFARFRAKLVAAMLAMTVVPALLVLVSGSQIITNIASVWFSEPVNEVLGAAQKLSQTYYRERQDAMELRAHRLAQELSPVAVSEGNLARLTPLIEEEPKTMRDGLVDLYRAVEEPGRPVDVQLLAAAESHTLAQERVRASADQLAMRAVQLARAESSFDELDTGGILIRAASPIFNSEQKVVGAVVVSQHVGPEINALLVRAIAANERYQGLRVLRGPIQGFYLSIFLTVTLLIVISATWLGLYLAKRITRPVQMLAEGAKAIGAGQLDLRLEAESGDELGSLVESFNMMAAELQTSRGKLEQSRQDLERKNLEVDARRRYIETILERVATGVISLDADGRISTVNGAAERLLGLDASAIGRSAGEVFGREDLRALQPLVDATRRGSSGGVVQEITLAREDREVHLAAAATVLTGDAGRPEGAVLVLDDVTPLIRAQRVAAWRDVARRLAHEIKNPLTPIQLSAERLRRHFGAAPEATRALVSECTDAIIVEVEALKNLVDEFAQFARLRGPRLLPCDLNKLIDDTLQLYASVLQQGSVQFVRQFARDLPPIRLDVEQIRQVVINLIDNGIEALGGPSAPTRANGDRPTIALATSYDARNHTVRLVVTDNGPGVAPADRDKLFMPYYSTKGRGSGLGLAICRRIVVEHGGAIEVSDAQPTGTMFTIELAA
jgi:two-component system nitrogen regulation sensor histidine kinase NtrY